MAATIGPAANSGPMPGNASAPIPASHPNTPPITPPVPAPMAAPSALLLSSTGCNVCEGATSGRTTEIPVFEKLPSRSASTIFSACSRSWVIQTTVLAMAFPLNFLDCRKEGLRGGMADRLTDHAAAKTIGRMPPSFSSRLADISLPDADGKQWRLGDFWADRSAVIVFLRHYG